MGRFDTIKTTIDANIKENGSQEITGQIMNNVLTEVVYATDAELTELESEKMDGQYISNSEYVRVYVDNEGKILWGIRHDGEIEFAKGVPSPIRKFIGDNLNELAKIKVDKEENKGLVSNDIIENFQFTENEEFVDVTIDSNGKIIEGVKRDGTHVFNLPIKLREIENEVVEDEIWMSVTTDSDGKIIEGVKRDGTHVFFNNVEIKKELVNLTNAAYKNIMAYEHLVQNGLWDAAIFKALEENDVVYIPKGEYDIINSIVIPRDNITIIASHDARVYLNSQENTRRVIYGENKNNITIIGGYWDAETKLQGSNIREHSSRGALSFFRCTRLTIKDCTIKCFGGSFCIQPGSCSNMTIDNIYFDGAKGCGVQVGGNTHTFTISNLSGNTDDDFVALNGYDWWTSSAEIGTIQNGFIYNLHPNYATAAIRINVGMTEKDGMKYVGCVRDINIQNIYGTFKDVYAIHIGSELDEFGKRSAEAFADNIYIRNVNCTAYDGTINPTLHLFGNIGTLTLESISDSGYGLMKLNGYAKVNKIIIRNYVAVDDVSILNLGGTINRLIFENANKDVRGTLIQNGGTINNITISNCDVLQGIILEINEGSIVKKMLIDNCLLENSQILKNLSEHPINLIIDNTETNNLEESEGLFNEV